MRRQVRSLCSHLRRRRLGAERACAVYLHVPAVPSRLLARCANCTDALRALRTSYVERYRRGESLEAIANAVQLPPTMLARMVLEELWDLKKGKEVTLPVP